MEASMGERYHLSGEIAGALHACLDKMEEVTPASFKEIRALTKEARSLVFAAKIPDELADR
jgi:hypothetical protein